MLNHPDEWQLVKISGTDPHYRVFASWRGGYLDGDSWKLNSGIVSVKEDDKYYYFKGHSGSLYKCHKKSYGIRSPYNGSVLAGYVTGSQGTLEVIEDMPDVMNIDWIINGTRI